MDISCDIIRDLLPLYAEELVSEDSKKLVDEHVCTCESCTKELGKLKKSLMVPAEVGSGSLKRVENTIRRRRVLAVLTALLLMATLWLSVSLLLDAKIYLRAEQAVQSVERREDGTIVIYLNDNVTGVRAARHDNPKNYGTIAWSNLSKVLFPSERVNYEDLSAEYQLFYSEEEYDKVGRFLLSDADAYNVWYCDAWSGDGEALLWDAEEPQQTNALLNVNYHLAYYCMFLAAAAILLAIPGWKISDKWYGELCARVSILLCCLCLSAIIVSAGQFAQLHDEFASSIAESTIITVPMTLAALLGRQLLKLNKQDKGL